MLKKIPSLYIDNISLFLISILPISLLISTGASELLSIILAKIPIVKIGLFEDLIYDIFNKKIEKIEELKNKLEYIYTLSENVN